MGFEKRLSHGPASSWCTLVHVVDDKFDQTILIKGMSSFYRVRVKSCLLGGVERVAFKSSLIGNVSRGNFDAIQMSVIRAHRWNQVRHMSLLGSILKVA